MSEAPLKPNLGALTAKDFAVLQSLASVEPPKNAPLIPSSPLDIKRYNQTLEAPDIPTFEDAIDHTAGVIGFGPGGPAEYRELLHELTEGDQVRVLHANNIRPVVGADGKPIWEMKAFIVGSDIEFPTKGSVRFPALEMLQPGVNAVDHIAYSYHSFESNIQRKTAVKTTLELGIPGVFKVSSSYGEVSATATKEKEVKIFSEASHLIPKAKIVISDDITLHPKFVSELEKLVKSTDKKQAKMDKLLDLLTEYGQFVAISMMLGGRITFHTDTDIADKIQYKHVKKEFKAAADGRFSIEGVPFEAGGGAGVGTEDTETTHIAIQSRSLRMEVHGGDENLAAMKEGSAPGRVWKDGQSAATWVGSLAAR